MLQDRCEFRPVGGRYCRCIEKLRQYLDPVCDLLAFDRSVVLAEFNRAVAPEALRVQFEVAVAAGDCCFDLLKARSVLDLRAEVRRAHAAAVVVDRSSARRCDDAVNLVLKACVVRVDALPVGEREARCVEVNVESAALVDLGAELL